jgi:protein SCO1/2
MRKPLYAFCARAVRLLLVLGVLGLGTKARGSTGPTWTTPPDQKAAPSSGLPDELLEVSFDQKLGASLPLELRFRDESGAEVALGRYFRGRPVVLSLVYFECPMLCSMALNGLTRSLRVLDFDLGDEFDVITLSFDPSDTPELADAKKANYVQQLGQPEAAQGWHFLTGDADAIAQVTETVGFRYVHDERSGQYAHAAGIVVLTPGGVVARYFFGIDYPARDLRLGLVEASEGKVGSVVDQVLLYCFQYDPSTGTYSAVVLRIVRLGGVLSLVGFALLFWTLRRREHTRRASSGSGLPNVARGGS